MKKNKVGGVAVTNGVISEQLTGSAVLITVTSGKSLIVIDSKYYINKGTSCP
jgi:hypothetical protein